MPLLEDIRVVVRQLFAGSNVADGLYPDATVIDDRVAIRITRMVDESRFVSVDGRIDHNVVVDGEQISVMALARLIGILRVSLGGSEPLSTVFDEPGAGADAPKCKRTPPLNRRLAYLERNFYYTTLRSKRYP